MSSQQPVRPPEPGQSPSVLVVDDEVPIRTFLRATLAAHGFRVREAGTVQEGLLQVAMEPPDVVVLDLGLPDGDGLDLVRQVRAWSQLPILVLSARGQERDKVAALDAGADDYLTKPFGVKELMARLRVAMRHAARTPDAEQVYEARVGDRVLRVDLAARVARLADLPQPPRELRLTPTEYKLLAYLAQHAGKVVTHQQVLRQVWGPPHEHDVQYLRVYAAQLRQKLELQPANPQFLLTEPGVGYRLIEAAQQG